eukprot:SAG31_NODE_151_length_22216_cov_37.572139_11_plen_91_part_00
MESSLALPQHNMVSSPGIPTGATPKDYTAEITSAITDMENASTSARSTAAAMKMMAYKTLQDAARKKNQNILNPDSMPIIVIQTRPYQPA